MRKLTKSPLVMRGLTLALIGPGILLVTGAGADADPVLVRGTIQGAAGSPGALTVLAEAWPSAETLDALSVGGIVKTIPVDRTVADRRGAYELRYDPAELPAEYIAEDGSVDIRVTVGVKEDPVLGVENLTVARAGRAWTTMRNMYDRRDAATAKADLPQIEIPVANPEARAPETPPGLGGGDFSATHDGIHAGCYFKKTDSIRRPRVKFMRTQGQYGYAQTTVTYSKASSKKHELGIAMVKDGVTYSAAGTSHKSIGVEDWDVRKKTATWKNKWTYRKYQGMYDVYTGASSVCSRYADWRPEAAYGGVSSVASDSYTKYKYGCTWKNKDGGMTRQQNRNGTFGAGVEMAEIKLKSQIDYTEGTKAKWVFLKRGKLCASNSSGLYYAPYISATS